MIPTGARAAWPLRRPSVVRTGIVAGTLASLASSAALMLLGRKEVGSYSAPTNATSHWVWDHAALGVYDPTLRHTLLGYAIHHASATFWAFLYAWLYGNRRCAQRLPGALAGASVAAATACLVDYTVTPKRLTPGFEHHLSKRSIAAAYAACALGLALGGLAANRQQQRR